MLQQWTTAVVAAFLYLTVVVEGTLSLTKNPSVRFFSNTDCTGEPADEQEIDTCLIHTGEGNSLYGLFTQETKQLFGSFGDIDYPVTLGIYCSTKNPLFLAYTGTGNNCSYDAHRTPSSFIGGISAAGNAEDYCLSMPTRGTSVIFTCPPPSTCTPQYKLNKKACQKRIKKCHNQGVPMKWAGKGCKNNKGKRLGDGGCQCKGYCGYQCAKACNKDKNCKWGDGRCLTKTGNYGHPIETCAVPIWV